MRIIQNQALERAPIDPVIGIGPYARGSDRRGNKTEPAQQIDEIAPYVRGSRLERKIDEIDPDHGQKMTSRGAQFSRKRDSGKRMPCWARPVRTN